MAELRRYNPKTQKWEPLLGGGGANPDIVAPAYDSVSTSYSINDLVIENNKLYSAKGPIEAPAEEFNPSKWNETDIASAKADLVDGKVPVSQLPSYVDDVVEYATYNDLPQEGEQGKIYVVLSDNKVWRWSGSTYIEIAANEIFRELIISNVSGSYFSNYTSRELKSLVDEGKTLIYNDCVLKVASRQTIPRDCIGLTYFDPQDKTIKLITVFEDGDTTFQSSYNIPNELNAKASKSSVDAIKNGTTINSFGGVESALSGIQDGSEIDSFGDVETALSGIQDGTTIDSFADVESALSDKIDEPESEGSDGYVLTTNGNGGRRWSAPSSGGSDVSVIDDTDLVIDGETISGTPLSQYSLGSIIKVDESANTNENTYVDYYVVEKKTDSQTGDFTQIILLRCNADDLGSRRMGYSTSSSSYQNGPWDSWLSSDSDFLARFKPAIYNAIVPTNISVRSGSSTMDISRKAFAPTRYQLDDTVTNTENESVSYMPALRLVFPLTTDNAIRKNLANNPSDASLDESPDERAVRTGSGQYTYRWRQCNYDEPETEHWVATYGSNFKALSVAISVSKDALVKTDNNDNILIGSTEIVYKNSIDKIQNGTDYYKIKDQDGRNSSNISYDNTTSGLSSTDVKNAIDELSQIIPSPTTNGKIMTVVNSHWSEADPLLATVEDNTTLVIKPGENLTIGNIYQTSGNLNKVVKIRETRNGVTEYHDYIPVDLVKTSNDEYVAILMRKYVANEDIGTFGSTNGSYYGSTAENWCNNTFKNYLSDYIKGQLRNVSCSIAITNGGSTMVSASVFLPFSYHMGGPNNNDGIDGSYRKWFGNYATDSDRVAELEGGSGGTRYWLSAYDSTYSGSYYNHKVIYVDGSFGYLSDTSTAYYRPVIAVLSSTPVVQTDENTFVTEGAITYTGTIDKVQDGNDLYKLADQDVRAMLAAPSVQGTYTLKCEVNAQGEPTISWVLDT